MFYVSVYTSIVREEQASIDKQRAGSRKRQYQSHHGFDWNGIRFSWSAESGCRQVEQQWISIALLRGHRWVIIPICDSSFARCCGYCCASLHTPHPGMTISFYGHHTPGHFIRMSIL